MLRIRVVMCICIIMYVLCICVVYMYCLCVVYMFCVCALCICVVFIFCVYRAATHTEKSVLCRFPARKQCPDFLNSTVYFIFFCKTVIS